jgi:hypothetical protein
VDGLGEAMANGEIEVLLVHKANPVREWRSI